MKLLKDINTAEIARTTNCIAYLLVTWIVSSLILTAYSSYLTGLVPESKFHREFIVCGGQIILQFFVIRTLDKNKVWEYLINMMTISFVASLTLLVFIEIGKWLLITNPLIYMGVFMLIVGCMFVFHLKRMKMLQLGMIPSATWLGYRLIVLIIIL